ncbi:hypothetical protein F4677DRAFT_415406 [Hypoxylon crocopeplum]|nr:hypothetical protein F4677DRAFT_415406 [Hypoxylon crocopeplum]
MVARHALTAAGCSHCRLAILKIFACPTNISPIRRAGPFASRPRLITTAPIRKFSSQPPQSQPSSDASSAEGANENDALDSWEQDRTAEDTNLANVPWYLQVDPPRHVASIEPPPLPEVPEGSPEVIGSLLKYVSEELGLDELSLLDLRPLDPPPALGPNLFMLFGTARSERHLNVSAGRLLRWLRAEHRIWAHADGLLGPNERKTKLRRKAKRAKLLGGDEDTDDGIKTGWICVNLGTVGRGKEQAAVVAEDGRVAGFGVSRHGHTIVVQIMTEYRRAEMGLEILWKRALGWRADKSPKPEAENLDNLHPIEEAIMARSHSPTTPGKGNFNDASRKTPFEQARFYSTQRATIREAPESNPLFQAQSKEELEQVLISNQTQKYRLLELLRSRLDQLSPLDAQLDPGVSHKQQVLTPFLRLSNLACQGLPPSQTWGFRLDIQTKAYEYRKHSPMETLTDVRRLIDEMQLYCIEPTRQQCLQLLTYIYSPDLRGLREQTKLALQLLKTIQQRGHSVLANDIIVTIIEAAAQSSSGSDVSQDRLGLIRRLETVLLQADLPCMDEPLIMRLMGAYAELRNWEGFWNAWRIPPRYLRPRSAAMYIHIFQLAAASNSSPLCIMTARRCFQEMLAEDPPVPPTGAVRDALMECIRVADPRAEHIVRSLSADSGGNSILAKGEFVKMIRDIQFLAR